MLDEKQPETLRLELSDDDDIANHARRRALNKLFQT